MWITHLFLPVIGTWHIIIKFNLLSKNGLKSFAIKSQCSSQPQIYGGTGRDGALSDSPSPPPKEPSPAPPPYFWSRLRGSAVKIPPVGRGGWALACRSAEQRGGFNFKSPLISQLSSRQKASSSWVQCNPHGFHPTGQLGRQRESLPVGALQAATLWLPDISFSSLLGLRGQPTL